ncbi:hypothetical protein EG329_009410 [Mollisiaceae sp. DMI_Dod_QoI]|nr:hypothetical protein EG329_009410 [Helotiales sp. DMI_Dod_QoI]
MSTFEAKDEDSIIEQQPTKCQGFKERGPVCLEPFCVIAVILQDITNVAFNSSETGKTVRFFIGFVFAIIGHVACWFFAWAIRVAVEITDRVQKEKDNQKFLLAVKVTDFTNARRLGNNGDVEKFAMELVDTTA